MGKRPSKRTGQRPVAKAKRPVSAALGLRGKVWVDIGGVVAMTEAGADLLEQVAACGSVSEAARRLRFSYRRAWMLMDAMNRRWHGPLVTKAIGGKQGGGTRLTELGEVVLRSFRDLQLQFQHLLDESAEQFARATGQRG